MIGPEHERLHPGAEAEFSDSISVDFCDGERGLFGLAGLVYHPDSSKMEVIGLLFSGGERVASHLEGAREQTIESWERVETDGLRLATEAPLERWSVAFSFEGAGFDLELRAGSPPVDLTGSAGVALTGVTGTSCYEQLCEVQGRVEVGGKSHSIRCTGRRTHAWGAPDWERVERLRSLYAAFGAGRGVTVHSVRPPGSGGHGEELIAGHLLQDEAEPLPLEQVRLSTIYDATGEPDKAGLELYLPGDEFPRRLAGEAACGTSVDVGEHVLNISFFRWSMEGVPGFGRYETVSRK